MTEIRAILSSRGTRFNFSRCENEKALKTNFVCSEDDIITSVGKLSKLGSGFRTEVVGTSTLIISVPTELNKDHMEVMQIASQSESSFGCVTLSEVLKSTNWDSQRVKRALDLLLKEGMVWLDRPIGNIEETYWFPSLWKEALSIEIDYVG